MTDNEFPVYAGFWRRLCSILIDTVIVLPLLALSFGMSLNKWGAILLCPLFFLQGVAYDILFLRFFGQTPGMMLMRFKVVRTNLSSLRWREVFLRYSVDGFIGSIGAIWMIFLFVKAPPDSFDATFSHIQSYFDHLTSFSEAFSRYQGDLGLLWIFSEVVVLLFNEKKRAIHDFIAGTVVVRVDRQKEVLFSGKKSYSAFSKEWGVLLIMIFVLVALARFFEGAALAPTRSRVDTSVIGVQKGEGFLSSKMLASGAWIYRVQSIIPDPADSSAFLIAGTNFISSIGYDGRILKNNRLSKSVMVGAWVADSGDARLAVFVGRDACFSLLGSDGKILWSTPASQTVICATSGNLLGNSKTQFVVGYIDGTIQMLDDEGRLIWQKWGEPLSDLEASDAMGNGHDEIVEMSKTGIWMIRDKGGNPVTQYSGPVPVKGFSMIPDPGKDKSAVALFPDGERYMFYNLKRGFPLAEWNAGFKPSRVGTGLRAVWVDWNLNGDKSLAILDKAIGTRSVLTIFDANGNIQFREVFYGDRGALAVTNGATLGTQALLCAVDGKILEYQKN